MNLQTEEIQNINPEDIAGYRLVRSFFNNKLFSVFAMSHSGERLVCVSCDKDFEEASYLVETLNAPYELMLQDQTEIVEVQVNNTPRIFTAVLSTKG